MFSLYFDTEHCPLMRTTRRGGRCCCDWSTVACSDSGVRLTNVDALTASKYEAELHGILSTARPLDTSNVADCLSGTGLGFYIPDVTR